MRLFNYVVFVVGCVIFGFLAYFAWTTFKPQPSKPPTFRHVIAITDTWCQVDTSLAIFNAQLPCPVDEYNIESPEGDYQFQSLQLESIPAYIVFSVREGGGMTEWSEIYRTHNFLRLLEYLK